jgi:OOP family OmpA-OmpF porin
VTDEADRAAILARRRRFVAVALAGLGGCTPEPGPQVPSAVPTTRPVAVVPTNEPEPVVDSDGDGVFDANDQCPAEPAGDRQSVEHPGCPAPRACLMIIPHSELQVLAKIQFDRFSSKVPARAAPVLDEVAQVLRENPTFDLDVAGHCEKPEPKSTGNQRAKAVRDALVRRGVEAERLGLEDGGGCEPPSEVSRLVEFPNFRQREKK